MSGREIIEWIQEHEAEDAEIYVEVGKNLYKPSSGFDVLSEDCGVSIVVIR